MKYSPEPHLSISSPRGRVKALDVGDADAADAVELRGLQVLDALFWRSH
jgi:hypothetical protein